MGKYSYILKLTKTLQKKADDTMLNVDSIIDFLKNNSLSLIQLKSIQSVISDKLADLEEDPDVGVIYETFMNFDPDYVLTPKVLMNELSGDLDSEAFNKALALAVETGLLSIVDGRVVRGANG